MSDPASSSTFRSRSGILILALPVLVAAALRFHGLGWGLPDLSEEATPFFQAWQMWGWETGLEFEPDPRFYRYPSLTFYAHFLAQGTLVLASWLSGGATAIRDVPVEFLADRRPFLLASRVVSALFAVGAVAGVGALGRRVGGTPAGLFAGLLLALNAYHVDRSQFIDVDAALVCFVAWGLWACVRVAHDASWRNSLTAGVLVGLATSAKYTGAFLALALVAALVAARRNERPPAWAAAGARLAAAGVIALVAFAATSPFVLLRIDAAMDAVAAEREHMRLGHFGLDEAPTWLHYGRALVDPVLGWPLAVAAAAGAALAAGLRRRPWAFVLLAFLVGQALAVGSWEMRTERYLLPFLPALVVLPAALLLEVPARARWPAAVLGALVLSAPSVLALPRVYERIHPATRTLAREWIEEHCPEGSFLVLEAWGPHVIEPEDLWRLSPQTRARFLELRPRPVYAVQNVPTFQVMPEVTEAFYDLGLYPDADFFVLSSDVGDRYRRDPERFPAQAGFYETLEARTRKVAEFVPGPSGGPTLTIYQLPQVGPFGRRKEIAGPRPLSPDRRRPPQGEAAFFKNLGLNYETFGFVDAAVASYQRALSANAFARDTLEGIAAGTARCLLSRGDPAGAAQALRAIAAQCPYPRERARILAVADQIAADAR